MGNSEIFNYFWRVYVKSLVNTVLTSFSIVWNFTQIVSLLDWVLSSEYSPIENLRLRLQVCFKDALKNLIYGDKHYTEDPKKCENSMNTGTNNRELSVVDCRDSDEDCIIINQDPKEETVAFTNQTSGIGRRTTRRRNARNPAAAVAVLNVPVARINPQNPIP